MNLVQLSLPNLSPRAHIRSDQGFLAPVLEVLETPPSPFGTALIVIICLLATTSPAWAYAGRIDIIVSAQGKIQPVRRVKVVQPLYVGKVVKLPPPNGSEVHRGDVPFELDSAETTADAADAEHALASYEAEINSRQPALIAAQDREVGIPSISWASDTASKLRQRKEAILSSDVAELDSSLASLRAQLRQKESEKDHLETTIAEQSSLVDMLQQRVDMRSTLAGQNAGPMAGVIDATETLKTQIAVQRGEFASAIAGIDVIATEIDKTRSAFIAQQTEKLGDAERQVKDLEQRLVKSRAVLARTSIRSPIDGVVQASAITTEGQVVNAGEEVLRVVPAGSELELEVYVPNRDIGFIHVGQTAVVKMDVFPFTQYGTVSATVTRIATDAIPQVDAARREEDVAAAPQSPLFAGAERTQNLVFAVTLRLDQNTIIADSINVALSPGMSATVEIATGSRRILSYLFPPIAETVSTAMKER